MSELTTCNYCDLQWFREEAKREGKVVTLRPGGIGIMVFAHEEGEALMPWPDEGPPNEANQVAEMMAISDRCCC